DLDLRLGLVERDEVADRLARRRRCVVRPRAVRDVGAAGRDVEVLPVALPRAVRAALTGCELGAHVVARDVVAIRQALLVNDEAARRVDDRFAGEPDPDALGRFETHAFGHAEAWLRTGPASRYLGVELQRAGGI